MEEKNVSGSHEHHGHSHEHHAHETKINHFKHRMLQCWEKCKNFRGISLKTAIIIALIVVLGTLLFVYKGFFIAASVNGSLISRYSVISELENRSGKAALDNLILEKLVNMEAAKNNIEISEEEINNEVAGIENQIASQGGTLEEALSMQGMTLDVLRGQIMLQKKMEALLGDKLAVTDAEINSYIESNKIEIPAGQEAEMRQNISNQIKQEKMSSEASSYLDSLKASSSIKYFINY